MHGLNCHHLNLRSGGYSHYPPHRRLPISVSATSRSDRSLVNTARTKLPLRFGRLPKRVSNVPDGSYKSGLWDDAFVLAIGRIITFFPLLERSMSEVMAELVGGVDPPVRQIFYSISNQQARIKIMRSLLQEAQSNKNKDSTWDAFIDDFASISGSRSDYAHGLWWTHDSGNIFLEPPDPSISGILNKREVTLNELNNVIDRMNDLSTRLYHVIIARLDEIEARNRAGFGEN